MLAIFSALSEPATKACKSATDRICESAIQFASLLLAPTDQYHADDVELQQVHLRQPGIQRPLQICSTATTVPAGAGTFQQAEVGESMPIHLRPAG